MKDAQGAERANNFYEEWLTAADRIQESFRASPMVARDTDIPWSRTRQDARVKLMISRSLGFPTMGGNVMKAEIPVGWHTGKHAHGEESLHILRGRGFSIIDGQRFDWHEGSTLQIPYRAVHQHFNGGEAPAQYLSAMCFDLEEFVHLAALEQFEDCGPSDDAQLTRFPPQTSEYLSEGPRVLIHLEDAPTDPGDEPTAQLAANQKQHHLTKYLVFPRNGFKPASVAMAHVFEEPPGHHSGRHKHLEAVLYVLSGEGQSEIAGTRERWQAGDILHVPPAMWEHEHFNQSDRACRLLRIQFGIRFWFTNIWPEGYTSQRATDQFGRPILAGRITSNAGAEEREGEPRAEVTAPHP
jgi:quercetin dioxygenase-like cupin family protein